MKHVVGKGSIEKPEHIDASPPLKVVYLLGAILFCLMFVLGVIGG